MNKFSQQVGRELNSGPPKLQVQRSNRSAALSPPFALKASEHAHFEYPYFSAYFKAIIFNNNNHSMQIILPFYWLIAHHDCDL